MTDAQLLEQFVTTASQPAFAALVERHIGWVSAVARRRVRDPHLADDVTQAVFILLAQKAKSLTRETVLAAWLFQATRYSSLAILRAERRRQRREQRAAEIMRQQTSAEDDVAQRWEQQLAPELDELVSHLSGTDRRAILLRFYEQKTYGEVGDALGISEDAARKRVTRAVDKLASLFHRRGVTVSAVLLATAMTAHVTPATASAATAGIAATTAAAALSSASAPVAASATATAKSAAALLAWAQIKAAAAVALIVTAAAAVGGGTTMAVIAQTRKTPPPPATQAVVAAAATSGPAPATAPARIVTGRVVTPEEQPVPGAKVHLIGTARDDSADIVASTVTGADGIYLIPAPPDRPFGQLLIDAPPWAYSSARLAYDSSYSATLQPPTELEVTVLAPDGKPAVNLPIAPAYADAGNFALPDSYWSTSYPRSLQQQIAQRTDPAGKVRLARLPRGARIRLDALDDRFATSTYEDAIALADAQSTPGKQFKLVAAVTITGRVTLPDGSPAPGVRVGAQSSDHSKSTGWGSAITDGNGNYRIGKLRGPGDYHVAVDTSEKQLPSALRGKWTAIAREKLAVADGQQISGIDLKLIEGVVIRGRVLAKDTREPVKEMSVGAYGPAHPRSGGWVQSAMTDEKGEWSMRVPPGDHYLYLASQSPPGYVAEQRDGRDVKISADTREPIDFLLERMPGKPVAGRVVGPDGKPVAAAVVTIELVRGNDFFDHWQTTADADGKFSIKAIPAGSQLRAGAPGMQTLNAVKVKGGERDVTITLMPAVKVTLTGRVLDTQGKPLPRAKISLTVWNGMMGIGSGDMSVDADGRYAIKNVPPDKRYTLQAESPGYGIAQMEAKIKLDEKMLAAAAAADGKRAIPVEQPPLVLKRAASFVSGVVIDQAGKPVPDILVNVDGRDTAPQSKRTDASGSFEFADIVEGETISLNAFKDGEHGPETKVPAGSVDVTVQWEEPGKK